MSSITHRIRRSAQCGFRCRCGLLGLGPPSTPVGVTRRNHFHWFTDGLPRLAFLDRVPADVHMLVPAGLRPFHIETLRWLGLEGRFRETPERH